MVTSDAAVLVGHVRPVPEQPGFVLLVFREGTGNEPMTQIVGSDDRVVGFRSVDFATIPVAPERQASVRVGEEALWGYAVPDEPPHIGRRDELVAWLTGRVDAVADPLLRLQAAEFCGLSDVRRSAWRTSFDHMALVAPRSAEAWRDVIVLPTQVRASVARVIDAIGLDVPIDLGRDVGVRVGGDRLVVSFEPGLYEALRSHPTALTDIDRDTADVRRAFELDGPIETLAEERSTGGGMSVRGPAPVIVAVGERAQRVLHRLIRSAKGIDADLAIPVRARDHAGAASLTVWEPDRLVFEGDVGLDDLDAHLPMTDRTERPDLLVVFGARASEMDVAEHAMRLVRTVDASRYRRIAVIPHLPDPALSRSADGYERFLTSLAEAFDAVFVLSDHSPNLRYGLPYGPSRSYEASAARLGLLVSTLEAGRVAVIEPLVMSVPEGLPVHVLSSTSSSGSLSARRLFEYAIGGATAFSFVRTRSTRLSLTVTRDVPRDEAESLEEPVRRAGFSDLLLTYHQTFPASRGTKADVHLAQLRWRPMALSEFAGFCVRELETYGWRVAMPDGVRPDVEIRRGSVTMPIEFKAFGVDDDARPLRTPTKQRLGVDIVLLIDGTVHRGDYVRHVLQGRLPIGVGRLNVIETVYARRYVYLIRALGGNQVRYRSRILDAAFARILDPSTPGYGAGNAAILTMTSDVDVTIDGRESEVSVLDDVLRVNLVVIVASDTGVWSRHGIEVTLTQSGWRIGRWSPG